LVLFIFAVGIGFQPFCMFRFSVCGGALPNVFIPFQMSCFECNWFQVLWTFEQTNTVDHKSFKAGQYCHSSGKWKYGDWRKYKAKL